MKAFRRIFVEKDIVVNNIFSWKWRTLSREVWLKNRKLYYIFFCGKVENFYKIVFSGEF